jgi:hypothetical protein
MTHKIQVHLLTQPVLKKKQQQQAQKSSSKLMTGIVKLIKRIKDRTATHKFQMRLSTQPVLKKKQ